MQWPGSARLPNRQRESVGPDSLKIFVGGLDPFSGMDPAMQFGPGHNERFIWLEAVDRQRNIARRYSVALTKDVFEISIFEFSWGRIGTRGQSRTVSLAQGCEADRFIAPLLRRRAGAPRRIGVAYREMAQSA